MQELKDISLTGTVIHSEKYDTKTLLTTLNCSSHFDQKAAEAMGVKSTIYDDQGIRRPGCSKWVFDEWCVFGWEMALTPHQKAMFGDVPLSLTTLKITGDDVLKQDADGALKFNFTIIISNTSPKLREFLWAVKRGECAAFISKPVKAVEDHAKSEAANFGLFALPKEPKPTKAAKGNAAVVPPLKKKDAEAPAAKSESDTIVAEVEAANPKESATLASSAVMGERTRGRRRAQAEEPVQ